MIRVTVNLNGYKKHAKDLKILLITFDGKRMKTIIAPDK
jgi:hypothetical protein